MRQPQFSVLGFPVRVETNVFFLALFIGFQIGVDAIYLIAVFFFSILLHELGHALAFRRFGCSSFITIHGMGGTTSSSNTQRLTDRQHILVSLAGPLSQLFLLGIPAMVVRYFYGPYGYGGWILSNMVFINVGWALLNLLPIYPLDGGQVLHRILRIRTVSDPWRVTQITTIAFGVPVAAAAYYFGYRIGALLVAYMVFRGVTSARSQGSSVIGDAATRARADHRQQNVKGPGKEEALREAYGCLLDGNITRLTTLANLLSQSKANAELTTLKAWDAVLYGNDSRFPTGQIGGEEPATQTTSALLRSTVSAVSGRPLSESGIEQELTRSLQSPELLTAVVLLAKYQQLDQSLQNMSDQAVSAIRDALVTGGLPQEQMAVSRILRLRREAATGG